MTMIKLPKRIIFNQLIILILFTLATLIILNFYFGKYFLLQARQQLQHSASALQTLAIRNNIPINKLCSSPEQNLRITVIRIDGSVICDSHARPQEMNNHLAREEIAKALEIGKASATRFSATLGKDLIYAAIRLNETHLLRLATPMENLNTAMSDVTFSIFIFLIPLFLLLSIVAVHFFIKNDLTEKQRSNKMKEDFIANISHEVRTPLTSLKGFVQLLKAAQQNFTHDQKQYLDRIESNSKRLETLFRDILELSVLEHGQHPSWEIISSRDLISKILEIIEINYKNKNISLKSSVDSFEFEGNAKIVEQLLANLIDNAYKYTHDHGAIEIIAKTTDHSFLFSIQDNGIGIPLKAQGRIFERFYRVDKSRSRDMGGTGLGLAIVKHAVNRHHGRVWLESVENKGSTFYIELPLKQS